MELGSLFVETFSDAIAIFEGFWTPGSRPERNRNPGDLRAGRLSSRKDSGGYAIYETYDNGWTDLRAQVLRNIQRGVTLLEFFAGKPNVYGGFAPALDQNEPETYAKAVAAHLYKKGWTVPLDAQLLNYL